MVLKRENAMPVIIRGENAKSKEIAGCLFTALLRREDTGSDQIELDHLTMKMGATHKRELDGSAVGWLQVLAGSGTLGGYTLTTSHIAYLPLGFSGDFDVVEDGTRILIATVPNASQFDDHIADMPTTLKCVNWTREPVLQSEHDARKRVYLATAALAGTKAFKGEMITYPPGTAAPEHHHVGAEHFQYVLSGEGTAMLDGISTKLCAGDLLYNYEYEPHAFINESDKEFVFVEFFVPGPCETVWSPGANLCAWLPTGVDTEGRKPSRDIGYHVHGQDDGI